MSPVRVMVLLFGMLSVVASGCGVAAAGATRETAGRPVGVVMKEVRAQFAARSDELRVRDVQPSSAVVKQFGRLEATFHLDATYTNPFDPDEIDVEGEFTLPDGTVVSVPAFYFVPFEPTSGVTQLQGGIPFGPGGTPSWRLRFAPPVAGEYSVRITARDGAGRSFRTEAYSFRATPSRGPGFIRVSAGNPMYFEDSGDGSLFFATGSNVAWTRTGDPGDPVASYEYYFGRAKGLMSSTRVWLCHWAWLEWTPQVQEAGTSWMGYAGAGYYNQMMAAELDRVLELAEKNGLRVMLVTEDDNEQYETGGVEEWVSNPYNVVNGGPCVRPEEVFSSAEARKLYRKRLRYILARWGYSTSLWAINSWNDESEASPEVRDWLKEMRGYVHDLVREYRPIVYGSNFQANDLMDYAQAGAGDLGADKPNVEQECEFASNRDWFVPMLRESIWNGLARGMAAVMVWPHTMVDRLNAWDVFAPPLKLASGLGLNHGRWQPLKAEAISAKADAAGSLVRIVTLTPAGDVPEWGVKASGNTFAIDLRESSQVITGLGSTLYGDAAHVTAWRNPPTFVVDMPSDGELVLEVEEIGGGDQLLEVRIDDRRATRVDLTGGRRELRDSERWVKTPLPKGRHRVSVDNARTGGDWIRVRRYHFTFRESEAGRFVAASGLSNGERGFLYVQNQTYARLPRDLGQTPVAMRDVDMSVSGLHDGRYQVALFGTVSEVERAMDDAVCAGGSLRVRVDRLEGEVAVRVERVGREERGPKR
ncbi:MAG: DUF5060 domain-containing protein [Armatimonadota bacterium]